MILEIFQELLLLLLVVVGNIILNLQCIQKHMNTQRMFIINNTFNSKYLEEEFSGSRKQSSSKLFQNETDKIMTSNQNGINNMKAEEQTNPSNPSIDHR
mmetsp:Transcript_7466/g.8868  ORF Transcript_7466/g.8868 Transcript_7466/m.8868 type:complete len:99 (-) Transcript_7466:829-1125(-)